MPPHESAMLALQHAAGNRMVSGLIARAVQDGRLQRQAIATAPATIPSPGEAGSAAGGGLPADVNVGFNPIERSHKLIVAIDQYDAKGDPFDQRTWRRHVDFQASVAALIGMTGEQARQVNEEYSRDKDGGEGKRRLEDDLFGGGGSGHPPDLTPDQSDRLRALLAGTVGGPTAAAHAIEAQVAELHELLHGDLEEADVERAMTLLKAIAAHGDFANDEFERTYERLHISTFYGDLGLLGPLNAVRATMIVNGMADAGEAFKVGQERGRIEAIDAELKKATEGDVLDRLAAATTFGYIRQEELRKERQKLAADIQARAEQAAAEARELGGVDQASVDAAVRQHVAAVLGDPYAVATAVGGPQAAVIRGAAAADPGATTAGHLQILLKDDKLTPDALSDALRGVRDQAAADARRLHPPPAPEADVSAEERTFADKYFASLEFNWDARKAAGDPTFKDLLGRGEQTDAERNRALEKGRGQLDPVSELIFALQGDRKDLETAKRVLRDKSSAEIDKIRVEYFARTLGHSLDYELFGEAPTEAGEDNPQFATGAYLKQQGKASGGDRLLLEDYIKRPKVEGAVQEVLYIGARTEREYQYTIDNRGATGWWRDTWGNETRRLLDETMDKVRALQSRYLASAGWVWMPGASQVMRPEWTQTAEAQEMVHRMRLLRATIRGDREAYERATAELRAAFQAVASFVLQAALVAVLAPLAAELFAVEAVAGAAETAETVELVTGGAEVVGETTEVAAGTTEAVSATRQAAMNRLRAWAADTSAQLASSVAANKITYGDEYGWAELKNDLASGLGGSIAATGAEKLAKIGAEKLAEALGPKVVGGFVERLGAGTPGALAKDWKAGIAGVASDELVALAGTTGSMIGSAVAVGETPEITAGGVAKQRVLGGVSGRITKATSAGGRRLGFGGEAARRPAPRPGEEEMPEVPMSLPEGEVPATPERRTAPETTEVRPREGEPEKRARTSSPEEALGAIAAAGRAPAAAQAPERAPTGPVNPMERGIPADSAHWLQAAADQLGVVIKVRPVNPAAVVRLQEGALPKMELIKAKSINKLDLLIGAPPEGEGLVGLFKPHDPDPSLPADIREAALARKADRDKEFEELKDYYKPYVDEGLVRIENGLLKVADPRTAGGEGAPHGEFKAVAGDVDLFDITHADGTPLSEDERTGVENLLRSMGIGVEHGAHVWWPTQHPETFVREIYEKIVGQHMTSEQLVAFVPKEEPQAVWADTEVTAGSKATGERPPGGAVTPAAGVVAAQGTTPILGQANTPLGNPIANERAARELVRRLAAGDAGALTQLGVTPPAGYDPRGREWGIGQRANGEIVIIEGGFGAVDWEVFLQQGGRPIAHSHPLTPGREMVNPGRTVSELVTATGRGKADPDGIHVLPSVEDFLFCVEHGLELHDIQTPYVHLGSGRIGNPDPAVPYPLVSFRIDTPTTVGDWHGVPVYRSMLVGYDSAGAVLGMAPVYVLDLPHFGQILPEPPGGMVATPGGGQAP